MPKTSEMFSGRYLSKEDVGAGALFTIVGIERRNVAPDDQPEEQKWCLKFRETEKLFVLNVTNGKLCEEIFHSDDTDHWMGKHLVLFTDPTVFFGGKAVGGLRVRAPRPGAALPVPKPVPLTADDIPF